MATTQASCAFVAASVVEQSTATPYVDAANEITKTVLSLGASAYANGKADYVECHHPSALYLRSDIIDDLRTGGVFVLFAPWGADAAAGSIPEWTKRAIAAKRARFFVVNTSSGSLPLDADAMLRAVFALKSVSRTSAYDGTVQAPTTPSKTPATPNGSSCASSVSSSGTASTSLYRTAGPWQAIVGESLSLAIQSAEERADAYVMSRVVYPRSWASCALSTRSTPAKMAIGEPLAERKASTLPSTTLVEPYRELLVSLFGTSTQVASVIAESDIGATLSGPSAEYLLGAFLAQDATGTKRDASSTRWIIAGDAWSYDIGFSGLHHILASNENINVLVLDTDSYASASKSRDDGRLKKDAGLYAMNYGNAACCERGGCEWYK